jgi:hypothetical protein
MGLGQTIMYIVIPVAIVIFMLLGDTTGYNFSLKVNFIANFFAPLLAYTIVSSVGISFIFSETKSPMLEFILIGIITLVIVYLIAAISMYKAAKDKTVPGAAGKQTCQNYKMSSAMKHGIKIVIIAMATFFVVSMYPILQRPFAKLTEKMGVEDPQRIAYGIIGFYMAFMSLTSTSLAYFPALEEGCRMTDSELQEAFDRGYPTLNFLKYRVSQGEEAPLDTILSSKGSPLPKDLGLFRDKCGKKKSSKKISTKKLVAGKIVKGIIGKIYITKKTLPLHRSGKDAMCDDTTKIYKRTIQKGELFQFKNVGSGFDSFSTLGDGKCSKIGYIKNEYIRDGNVRPATADEIKTGKATSCKAVSGSRSGSGSGSGTTAAGTGTTAAGTGTTAAATTAPLTAAQAKKDAAQAIKDAALAKKGAVAAVKTFKGAPTVLNKKAAQDAIYKADVKERSKLFQDLEKEVNTAKKTAILELKKLKIKHIIKDRILIWDMKGVWAQLEDNNYYVVKIKPGGVFSKEEITIEKDTGYKKMKSGVAFPINLTVKIEQIKNINEPDNIIRKYMEQSQNKPKEPTFKASGAAAKTDAVDVKVYTKTDAKTDLGLYMWLAGTPIPTNVKEFPDVKNYLIKKLGGEDSNGELKGLYKDPAAAKPETVTITSDDLTDDTVAFSRDKVPVSSKTGPKDAAGKSVLTLAVNQITNISSYI